MRYLGLICFALLLAVVPVLAQQTCPVLVQEALTALGDNCIGLERNSACYGYNHVEATFSETVEENFFSQVADRAGLLAMQTLQTFPLDSSANEWGIAVMNVQANIPNTLPGQSVTFLLIGDAEVENDVDPDDVFQPVDGVEVTTTSITNLRATPDFNAPTVTTLPEGTPLIADAISDDAAFLRVVLNDQILWVDSGAVIGSDALSTLPELGSSDFTPMQSFYFSTGVGATECVEAPSLVAVNSPENIHVNLSVNGAEISVGSLITFQTTEDGAVMTVIEGGVENEDGLRIAAGEASDLELDEDNEIVEWGDPRPITSEEFAAGQTVQQAMFNLENPLTETVDDGVCTAGETIPHTVAPGENLFRISIRYGTTVADIAALNGIVDVTTIFAGQVLQIPCGSNTSGLSPMAGITQIPPIVVVTALPGANVCAGFRQTSPLGGYPNGTTPFFWDGVASATSYRVRIFNEQGAQVATFATSGNQTTVTGDMGVGTVGQGTMFTWVVDALVNGQALCSTGGLTLPRDQFPQSGGGGVTTVPTPVLTLTCPGLLVTMNWANVNPGSLISWNVLPSPGAGSTTSAGTGGSQVITTGTSSTTYSGTASSSNPPFSTSVVVTCP